MKKKLLKPALLIGAAVALLGASVANSTYAMLTIFSEDYYSEFELGAIGVTLQENGENVSWRDYNGSDDSWNETTGVLLQKMIPNGEKLQLGKKYKEELTVFNSGKIDTYVRVVLTKKWFKSDKDNNVEDYTLNPDLIRLTIKEGNGWRLSTEESSSDKIVMYYDKILKVGETTPAFTTDISIDPVLKTKSTAKDDSNNEPALPPGYKRYVLSYDYDGYSFRLAAETDAVQTHNAADAKESSWGVGNDDAGVEEPLPEDPGTEEPEEPKRCPVCDRLLTKAGEDEWKCTEPSCNADKDEEHFWKCTKAHNDNADEVFWNDIGAPICAGCGAAKP